MPKPPKMKYTEVTRRLRGHGAYFVREGSEHEIWRCTCTDKHQTSVPRHEVSSYVIGKIGQQMPCLGKEWWR